LPGNRLVQAHGTASLQVKRYDLNMYHFFIGSRRIASQHEALPILPWLATAAGLVYLEFTQK
jgi:hypothetical protein